MDSKSSPPPADTPPPFPTSEPEWKAGDPPIPDSALPIGSCLLCGVRRAYAVFTNINPDILPPRYLGVCEDCRNVRAQLVATLAAAQGTARQLEDAHAAITALEHAILRQTDNFEEENNKLEAAYAALREQAQFDLSHPCCQVGFLRAQALLEKAT